MVKIKHKMNKEVINFSISSFLGSHYRLICSFINLAVFSFFHCLNFRFKIAIELTFFISSVIVFQR